MHVAPDRDIPRASDEEGIQLCYLQNREAKAGYCGEDRVYN